MDIKNKENNANYKIEDLLLGVKNCECGKSHYCPVENVIIENNALSKLKNLVLPYKNVLVVADENTYEICGNKVFSLLPFGKRKIILKNNGDVVIPNEEKISEIESYLSDDTDLIIGVGSGVINDLCKYVSFHHNLPYFIVATAPSMDGFVSVGAAMILNGMKITVNARPPKAVIASTDILKNAPLKMLQSGYGDIIGKYSCLNDWKLSQFINDEYFCDRVYNLAYQQVKIVEPLAKKILNRDENAIGKLMSALIVVGIAMSFVDCSRPASGSEHHLSHFFEITGILDDKPYYSHGIDVLYSSVVTEKLREEIISLNPIKNDFDYCKWEKDIKKIYSSSADGVINLQNKLGWYNKNDYDFILKSQDKINSILKEAPNSDEMLNLVNSIGLDFNEFLSFYGIEKIKDAVLYAKDLKDRYSVLWLYYCYYKR